MQMKRVIISADDFGYSKENNDAVLLGCLSKNITSVGLMANMDGFENAVNEVIPQIPDIDIGFHFNIIEGKSLSNPHLISDTDGRFNKGFLYFLFNQNNHDLLSQIEIEFRVQIEKILRLHSVSHIDSHVHVHAIPAIFNLILKLAAEYNIKYIRTQRELPYIVKSKIFNKRFPINVIKNLLLNYLTDCNLKNSDGIYSNDFISGVLYTGYMDEESIYNALKKINNQNSVTEVLFHPYLPSELSSSTRMNNYREFLITKTPNFRDNLQKLGFSPVSFSDLISENNLV